MPNTAHPQPRLIQTLDMHRVARQMRKTSIIQVRAFGTKPPPATPKSGAKKAPGPAVFEADKTATTQTSTKTVAEKDAELMQKLAGISGEGGESGVEYEDGKASAMKRSVKNNMFRLI